MKDNWFIRGEKVPLTKEEIRAVTLNKLELSDAKSILDVGAGSGSVSIEACLHYKKLHATAIEVKEEACEVIAANKDKFGLVNYNIINGCAPYKLDDAFERIFIGGSNDALEKIIAWCFDLLIEGGIVVCNFIVYENAISAKKYLKQYGYEDIELCQVMINKSEKIGRYEYLKPINPVFILKARKGNNNE